MHTLLINRTGDDASEPTADDVALLTAGGPPARELIRSRLAALRRLRGISQAEGIAVWWLLLGDAPGDNDAAALALWLEMLRLLRCVYSLRGRDGRAGAGLRGVNRGALSQEQ